MSKSNPYLIVKSNRLINAHLNGLTLSQLKFFELLVAQLDRSQDRFQKQRIYLSDFVTEVGTKNKNEYQRAREITKSMMKHVVEIFDEKEGLMQRNIFHSIDYPTNKPYVEVVFHPHLLPYLLQLKEKFTSYDIRNTLPLNSVYAVQLYQLLKQYLNIGYREFQIRELKKILGVEKKYKLYADFKKRVILTSQRELTKNCDLTFDYLELKEGRRVQAIRFLIKPQTPKTATQQMALASISSKQAESPSPESPTTAAPPSDLTLLLNEMGIGKSMIEKMLEEEEESYLREVLEYTQLNAETNPAGFFVKLVKEQALKQLPKKLAKQATHRPKSVQKAPTKEERELIEHLRKEFEAVREAHIVQIMDKAKPEDWDAFKEYAEHNPLVKSKVFKNGKLNLQDKQSQFWFRVFLSDRLPDPDAAFIEWALKTKGYQIERDPKERTYRISGKQQSFF